MYVSPRSPVMPLIYLLFIVLAVIPAAHIQVVQAAGIISGTVFRDFNEDGVQQNTAAPGSTVVDRGIGGILVRAYDQAGIEQGSALTCDGATWENGSESSACTPAQIGTYQLTTSGTGPYRIEFTWDNSSRYLNADKTQHNPLFGLQPGPRSADSVGGSGVGNASSTVQFVQDGATSNVNLAVNYPTDYCQSNPQLVSNRVIIADPLAVPSSVANEDVLLTFPYSATGEATNGGTPYASCARYAQIGSTWGLTYQRTTGRVFASTVLKRHSGLGPLGVNGIYVANPNVAGSGAGWYNGINAGSIPSNSARGLTGTGNDITPDVAAFGLVGKVGFGDIDTSEDDTTLYVTNLADRKLYAIDIASVDAKLVGYTPTAYNIPDPGCTNGIARPWAVSTHRGFVYVGVVCTAELPGSTADDLSAHVYALDPSSGTWSASLFDAPLNYSKGCTFFTNECLWQTWTDSWLDAAGQPNFNTPGRADPYAQGYRPMPILSDIEFDEEGYMILGFLDRSGHMLGHRNAIPVAGSTDQLTGMAGGDLLIAAPPSFPGGKYILEADGRVGNRLSTGTGISTTGEGGPVSGQGPHNPLNGVGPGGEFFWDERIALNHSETSSGGLAYLPGSKEVTVSVMDPIQYDSGGVSWYNSQTGGPGRDYEIYFDASADAITAGKGNGIGDMELLCNAAPIEIGNRVWFDPDKNGTQDASEIPIAGVTVNLYDGNNVLLDTAVTNANGEWYFSSAQGTSSAHARYGVNLRPNQNYFIRLDNAQNYAAQGPLEKYTLTTPNVNGSADRITNNRNSKATLAVVNGSIGPGNYPTITYTTGGPGTNDHTLDIGFYVKPTAITLTSFTASPTIGGVLVRWATAAEVNTYGFRLVRSTSNWRADAVEITSAIILGRGRGQGASYAWVDTSAQPGILYNYWLVEVEVNGSTIDYGPTRVSLQSMIYQVMLPFIERE